MSSRVRLHAALAAGLLLAGCSQPKVTYRGLKLTRPPIQKVTERDVGRFLDGMRNQMAKPVPLPPDTPLRSGHRAIVDFVGTVGGSPFMGGTASAYPLVLGSGQMIPGFEEGVVGMRPGESRDVKAAFPKDYHDVGLAGKSAVFHVTVRAGESLVRPPLDDALAARVSGGRITSVADLQRAARTQIEQQKFQQADQSLKAQVAEALLVQWGGGPGRREVERELNRFVQQQLQQAAQRGAGPAQGGPDAASLREQSRPMVARSVKLSRILAWIGKQEHVVVTDGEVEQMAAQMAQGQGQDPQAFLTMVKQQDLFEVLRRRLLEDRVMTIILQNAQVEEPQRLATRGG